MNRILKKLTSLFNITTKRQLIDRVAELEEMVLVNYEKSSEIDDITNIVSDQDDAIISIIELEVDAGTDNLDEDLVDNYETEIDENLCKNYESEDN